MRNSLNHPGGLNRILEHVFDTKRLGRHPREGLCYNEGGREGGREGEGERFVQRERRRRRRDREAAAKKYERPF